MSISELRVVDANGILSESLTAETTIVINNITKYANPKPSEALMVNDIIIITGNKKVTEQSRIFITTPRIYKDYVENFEEDIQIEVRKIKEELNLSQTQMNKLEKSHKAEMKLLGGKQIDLQARLKILESNAIKIKEESKVEEMVKKLTKNSIDIQHTLNEIILNKVLFSNKSGEDIIYIGENLISNVRKFSEELRNSEAGVLMV